MLSARYELKVIRLFWVSAQTKKVSWINEILNDFWWTIKGNLYGNVAKAYRNDVLANAHRNQGWRRTNGKEYDCFFYFFLCQAVYYKALNHQFICIKICQKATLYLDPVIDLHNWRLWLGACYSLTRRCKEADGEMYWTDCSSLCWRGVATSSHKKR